MQSLFEKRSNLEFKKMREIASSQFWPAVGDNGPGVPGVEHVYPPDELEEGGGVLRHTVVRPRRELELLHLAPVRVAHLRMRRNRN